MELISMSQKEADKYAVLKRLNDGIINGTQASQLLHLSVRQIRRLKPRATKGAEALIHANRGKPGNRKLPEPERKKIVKLLHKKYEDFGPTFAREKLAENHKIVRDPKTIRRIQIEEGLWKPKKKKNGSEHRSWRQRRSCYGEMEQFDGSYEAWLEDRLLDEHGLPQKLCLLASIDDATGKITKAIFADHEGVIPVFTFWKQYLEEHGKPRAIYLDKFSTYQMNSALAKDNPDLLTQFQRAAQELHIELIPANSPQAKGRVERLFETLQDRLIKELRLAKISTKEKANIFLETYLSKFNEQFGVEPQNTSDLHTVLTQKEHLNLSSIFSHQETRVVQNDFTLSYTKQWYQLVAGQPVTVCKRDQVIMERHLDGSIQIRLRGKILNYEILPERPKKTNSTVWILPKTTIKTKPDKQHPWRKQIHADVKVSKSH
jgi:hypothetical protein